MTTTAQLAANIVAQFEAKLGQDVPLLPVAVLRVIALAVAGVWILLYKFIGFGTLQGFVQTASATPTEINGKTITPLEFWGELIGVGLPRRATQAELTATVTVQQLGGLLPAGAQLVYPPTGVTYLTVSAVALSAGSVPVAIRAAGTQDGKTGAGVIGNLPVATVLYFANPLPAVAKAVTVTGSTVTGADAEPPEDYRQRVLNRFRARPQGGALADYRVWATVPAGIREAFPYRSAVCPGQIDVYIESSTEVDGIPTAPQLTAALASINGPYNKPVSALVNVYPITRLPFDVAVHGLITTDPVGVHADIQTALTEYLLTRKPFIEGLDYLPAYDRITVSGVAGVVERVVSATGATFGSVTLSLFGVPSPGYTLAAGQESKLGTLSFV